MDFSRADRPMLIFVSDIHLTDALHGASVPREILFKRFWTRIQESRGKRPAHLCFAGDLFDIVRSPSWLNSATRPYHEVSPILTQHVEGIVSRILEREAKFFEAIRVHVERGELAIHYLLGNHDRLLMHAPNARRAIWKALTGEDKEVEFPCEMRFEDHQVLAYHGHLGDPINHCNEGHATIGDAIGSELITRFPKMVKNLVDPAHASLLDDIDDVRPIYAVPAWVRQLGVFDRELLMPVQKTWAALVEEFLSKPFVRIWMREQRRPFGFDTGKKLKLLLELSTGRIMARSHDKRLTSIYKMFQHGFDGRMATQAASRINNDKDIRFVVNGHSHFASMVPLGRNNGNPSVYFNTGTWRTVHQIGNALGGRPSFLPYEAMSYLVFFPADDPIGRDFEWWSGAMVGAPEQESSSHKLVQ